MSTAAISRSTNRFIKLFSAGAEKVKDPSVRKLENCAFELRVLNGMHVGATQLLTQDTHTVGASEDNDFMLVDLGKTRLRLERKGACYAVFVEQTDVALGDFTTSFTDAPSDDAREANIVWNTVSAAEHYERTVKASAIEDSSKPSASLDRSKPLVRDRFEMCDVYVFERAAFELVTIADAKSEEPDSGVSTSARRTTTKVVCVGAFFAVTGIVYAISAAYSKDDATSAAVRGNVALAQSTFSNVHTRRAIDGGAEFAGIVSDEKELTALTRWAADNGFPDVRMRVLRLDQFRDRLRESLSGADVKVQLTTNGALRVEGAVKTASVSDRLNAIIKEIGNAVTIENRLTVSADKVAPVTSGLPFRVATFKPGRPGYVEIEGGLRYFEGSVTADGFEVVRVDANSARFSRLGRELVYSIN
jgi:hypothetical protein